VNLTTASPVHMNCRVYATLLLLYPSTLRRQFGEEMIEVFADQMRDACQRDGWVGGIGVWCCVGGETLRTVLSSHLQMTKPGDRRDVPRFSGTTCKTWGQTGRSPVFRD
jgi:hypothetical protein